MSKDSVSSDKQQQVPPPPDPFPTYQTPFPRSSSSSDDPNAFILFRRFADAQLSSLFSRLSLIPEGLLPKNESSSTQLRSGAEPQHELKHQHLSSEGFWKGIEQDQEELRMQSLGSTNTVSQSQQNVEGSSSSSDEAFTELALYDGLLNHLISAPVEFQGLLDPPNVLRKFKSMDQAPVVFEPAVNEPQAFLWWTNSSYSPFRLQNDSQESQLDSRLSKRVDWDTAFHELIRSHEEDLAADGGDDDDVLFKTHLLNSYDAARRFKGIPGPMYGSGTNKKEAARDWMIDLDKAIARSWPNAWTQLHSRVSKTGLNSESSSQSSTLEGSHCWSDDLNSSRGGVSYNSTSTNRTTLPDGTIEIKQVRRRRYSNGREETTESIWTEPPPSKYSTLREESKLVNQQTNKNRLVVRADDVRNEARQYGKGWFWS